MNKVTAVGGCISAILIAAAGLAIYTPWSVDYPIFAEFPTSDASGRNTQQVYLEFQEAGRLLVKIEILKVDGQLLENQKSWMENSNWSEIQNGHNFCKYHFNRGNITLFENGNAIWAPNEFATILGAWHEDKNNNKSG
jgi:hypothetical protein